MPEPAQVPLSTLRVIGKRELAFAHSKTPYSPARLALAVCFALFHGNRRSSLRGVAGIPPLKMYARRGTSEVFGPA